MTPSEPDRRREPARSAEEPPSEGRGPRSQKLPYRPPRLVVYGRLTEVTRFGGSQIVDSGNNLGNLQ